MKKKKMNKRVILEIAVLARNLKDFTKERNLEDPPEDSLKLSLKTNEKGKVHKSYDLNATNLDISNLIVRG